MLCYVQGWVEATLHTMEDLDFSAVLHYRVQYIMQLTDACTSVRKSEPMRISGTLHNPVGLLHSKADKPRSSITHQVQCIIWVTDACTSVRKSVPMRISGTLHNPVGLLHSKADKPRSSITHQVQCIIWVTDACTSVRKSDMSVFVYTFCQAPPCFRVPGYAQSKS